MTKKPNPIDVLLGFREKASTGQACPLAEIPEGELSLFAKLRSILAESKLLKYLDKSEEANIDDVVLKEYLDQDAVIEGKKAGMSAVDTFIYSYDSIVREKPTVQIKNQGDLRRFTGAKGFRELFMALDRACRIHLNCSQHLSADYILTEPETKKATSEARTDSFAPIGQAKEVFGMMEREIRKDIEDSRDEPPQVYIDALEFARDFVKDVLKPLHDMGKKVKGSKPKN